MNRTIVSSVLGAQASIFACFGTSSVLPSHLCLRRLVVLTLAVLVCLYSATAQNETGTRIVNKPRYKFNGYWVDTNSPTFGYKFPILRDVPPISSHMSIGELVTWIGLDSLLRYTESNVLDSTLETWSALNDTLTWAMRQFYKVVDADPVTFNQYCMETSMQAVEFPLPAGPRHSKRRRSDSGYVYYDSLPLYPLNNQRYRSRARQLYGLAHTIRGIRRNTDDSLALSALLQADYVLRVKVLSIDSITNTRVSYPNKEYGVLARVIDTIKGQRLPTNHAIARLSASNPPANPTLRFSYFDYQSMLLADQYGVVANRDTSFVLENGDFRIKLGQELLIFLNYEEPKVDEQHDYLELGLTVSKASFPLAISDEGFVLDHYRTWLPSGKGTYEQWLARFEELKSLVLERFR